MDVAGMRERVVRILLAPKDEWVRTIPEDASLRNLLVPYVAALAGLAAVGSFVADTLVGATHVFPDGQTVTVRTGFLPGLLLLVLTAGVYVGLWGAVALLVELLAPSFDARQERPASFKLATYALTPFWLAGALATFSTLHGFFRGLYILALIAGTGWSFYLLATGLPILLGAPEERAPLMSGLVAGASAIAVGVSLNLLSALLGPSIPVR